MVVERIYPRQHKSVELDDLSFAALERAVRDLKDEMPESFRLQYFDFSDNTITAYFDALESEDVYERRAAAMKRQIAELEKREKEQYERLRAKFGQ